MKLSLLLFLALLLPAAAFAQDNPDAPPPRPQSGFICKRNEDCVKIDNSCGGIAINQDALDTYEMVAQNLDTCKEHWTPSVRDVARCINGYCVLYSLSDDEFRQEWVKCDYDAACAVAYDNCADFAINKQYLSLVRGPKSCPEPQSHNYKAIARCIKNTCTLQIPSEP